MGESLGQWGGSLAYLAFLLVIIYFLMIRPQQKQQKQRAAMLSTVKVDDKIVTIGGIYGRVIKIREDVLTVRIADKTEVEMERNAVNRILGKDE
ncbi:MAG: preprotein translocase subunit YajC [Bacillota bacterium]